LHTCCELAIGVNKAALIKEMDGIIMEHKQKLETCAGDANMNTGRGQRQKRQKNVDDEDEVEQTDVASGTSCSNENPSKKYKASDIARRAGLKVLRDKEEQEAQVVEAGSQQPQKKKTKSASASQQAPKNTTQFAAGSQQPQKKTTESAAGSQQPQKKTTESAAGSQQPQKKTTESAATSQQPQKKTTASDSDCLQCLEKSRRIAELEHHVVTAAGIYYFVVNS
jgi:hypothetical protein